MVLGILEPKWDEVKGGWRKLHNEELHNLCSWPSIIGIMSRRDDMCRACDTNKGGGH
jgi:hypothetical protein